MSMNRWDMKRMEIDAGDHVHVKTKRGSIVIKVRRDKEIPEGMVFIPFCFAEAAANVLTNPQLDPYGKIPEFKFAACRVSAAAAVAAAAATGKTVDHSCIVRSRRESGVSGGAMGTAAAALRGSVLARLGTS